MWQKIKNYLSEGNRATWCVFAMFAFAIFLKGMIFHWNSFHTILISTLWHNPLEFIRFWGGKIVPAILLGSFVFLSKRKYWTIIVLALLDIWIIANIFYYNANGLYLSYETMQMADNMSGFWDSLYSYTEPSMILYPLITLIYGVALYLLPKMKKRLPIHFGIALLISICMSIIGTICYHFYVKSWHAKNAVTQEVMENMLSNEDFHYYFPFGHVYYFAAIEDNVDYNVWAQIYIKEHSIISYLPASLVYNWIAPAGEIIELTQEEERQIQPYIHGSIKDTPPAPQANIIFVLFESLESWPIDEVCGYHYVPNLTRLSKSEQALYAKRLTSQVRHGNSADGQMIDVTGLLPISNGATCRLYYNNLFPSIAHGYPQSAIVNAASGTWMQDKMTYAYQFKQLIEPKDGSHWDDAGIIHQMINYVDTVSEPFCVLGITVTSHVPFTRGSEHPTHVVSGMPGVMSAYLNCLSYTDSLIGVLVEAVYGNEKIASNTLIVISGDHTIFRTTDGEMDAYARAHGIDMRTTHTYTPLIIYSPTIAHNTYVDEVCYQMDIYPTMLHLIGGDEYCWHGLGVNLFDSTAIKNREVSEEKAFIISEKLIRSNYFGKKH